MIVCEGDWQKFTLFLQRGIDTKHGFLCTCHAVCVHVTCAVVTVHTICEGLPPNSCKTWSYFEEHKLMPQLLMVSLGFLTLKFKVTYLV